MMDSSSEWSWSNTVFDKSGNIYVGSEGSSAMAQLASVNDSGKLAWTVPSGTTVMPMPIGFDPQGRLYVSVAGRIVCLSN